MGGWLRAGAVCHEKGASEAELQSVLMQKAGGDTGRSASEFRV